VDVFLQSRYPCTDIHTDTNRHTHKRQRTHIHTTFRVQGLLEIKVPQIEVTTFDWFVDLNRTAQRRTDSFEEPYLHFDQPMYTVSSLCLTHAHAHNNSFSRSFSFTPSTYVRTPMGYLVHKKQPPSPPRSTVGS